MNSFNDETGVPEDAFLKEKNVYIKYSFEEVAFHWSSESPDIVMRKFFGTRRESKTTTSNRLFMDARAGGKIITRNEYNLL